MPHGSLRMGEIEVTALCDLANRFPRPMREAFPDVPADRWPGFRDRYPDTFDGQDGWLFHVHCYLIRTAHRTILVDTGVGPASTIASRWIGAAGRLPDELDDAGVDPGGVDTVVITHLHLDHIGWGVTENGGEFSVTFPNARYLINRAEWEGFRELGDEEDRAAFDQQAVPLQRAGVLDLVEGDQPLTDAVTVVATPGHTPGHQSVWVESTAGSAMVSGDLTNHPVQVAEPNWRSRGDQDPSLAGWTRRQWLDRVESRRSTLSTAHYPHPFSRLVRVDGTRYVEGS
ncbi:MAG: MBL fold metallo-hydrolase [Actinomycetota bacterium]